MKFSHFSHFSHFFSIIVVCSCFLFSSCTHVATISTKILPIHITPDDATVMIYNRNGRLVHKSTAPTNAFLKSGTEKLEREIYTVKINAEGYEEKTIVIRSKMNSSYWINALFFGFPQGEIYDLDRDAIIETLTESPRRY